MVAFDKVQLAEDCGSVEVVGQVLHVGQGVPVGGGDQVEAPKSPQGRHPSPGLFTMWRGDDQVEFEWRTIPNFSS